MLGIEKTCYEVCDLYVRPASREFVMVQFHLSWLSGIMYISHFRAWQPLGCKHEIKAGNPKPYRESLQTALDMITQETGV